MRIPLRNYSNNQTWCLTQTHVHMSFASYARPKALQVIVCILCLFLLVPVRHLYLALPAIFIKDGKKKEKIR